MSTASHVAGAYRRVILRVLFCVRTCALLIPTSPAAVASRRGRLVCGCMEQMLYGVLALRSVIHSRCRELWPWQCAVADTGFRSWYRSKFRIVGMGVYFSLFVSVLRDAAAANWRVGCVCELASLLVGA